MTKVTIFDIAQLAGVSIGTVSRVLNGRSDVSQATRSRVLKLVNDLGFVPDSGAQRLARGSVELIGVAAYNKNTARSPFYSILLDAIQEQLLHSGYAARLLDNQHLTTERCAGIIIPGIYQNDTRLAQLAARGIPHVVVGRMSGVSCVDLDTAGGLRQALSHLLDLGHVRVAYLTGSDPGQINQHKTEAYQAGLAAAGLAFREELVLDGDYTDLGGYRAVRSALEQGLAFTAVLCASDEMAIGALAALQDHGVQVPEEVSLVSLDDLSEGALANPALTSVHLPTRLLGRKAAEQMVDAIWGKPQRTEVVPLELVVRASSGPVRR